MSKRKNKPKKKQSMKLRAVIAAAVLCIMLYGYMLLQAHVVHIEYADVYLDDLPKAFEGGRILFLSDIHISSRSDALRMKRLMARLQSAKPDILLLGGDYSDVRAWDRLRCLGSEEKYAMLDHISQQHAQEWLTSLKDFEAPLGRFAVQGNHDVTFPSLESALADGGVKLLMNEAVTVKKDGHQLKIAGVGDYLLGDYRLYDLVKQVSARDCVILMTHNPDALPQISTTDAPDGGAWADLVLSGHTHGGQLRVGDFVPIPNSEYGTRYLTGWHEETGGYALTSNGVGCTSLPIRLNASAQAHLITLHTTH